MAAATITSKGQVTIPQRVRLDMKLSSGDRIEFVRMDDGNYAVMPASASIKALKGIVAKPDRPVSLQDMQAAIEADAPKR